MTPEDYNNLSSILEGNEEQPNAVESLIRIFRSPIAKRKGVIMSAEDCEEWAKELENYLKETEKNKL